ncbi:MAG: DUF368 domain-containing protein [Spirochaetia bacterium]
MKRFFNRKNTQTGIATQTESTTLDEAPLLSFVPKGLIGGVLMGLANLVPGVSGGTMLLAVGIYTVFITAVADITSLRFRLRSLVIVFLVAFAAALGILLLAGFVKDLVISYRWIAYSIFIGLTLGGVPVIMEMVDRRTFSMWTGAALGFFGMAAVAALQQYGGVSGGSPEGGRIMLFAAGIAGASAMILPGVSGGYLLLLLGQYIPILSALDALKQALDAGNWGEVVHLGLTVILPLGMGILLGVVLVSNVLKFLLDRFRRATLGVLLGVLLGAVVGLWPFQEGVAPEPGEVFKGTTLSPQSAAEISQDEYPAELFTPTAGQIAVAIILTAGGFCVTYGISRFEPKKAKPGTSQQRRRSS